MTDRPRSTPVQFRDAAVELRLAERTDEGQSAGLTAARDLERYYALLDHCLAVIVLTEAEASLICDALNGTLIDHRTYHLVWASVDDAIRLDGLDEKWGVDGPALVGKLRDLDHCGMLAIADAVDRFWIEPNPMPVALRRVGLVR